MWMRVLGLVLCWRVHHFIHYSCFILYISSRPRRFVAVSIFTLWTCRHVLLHFMCRFLLPISSDRRSTRRNEALMWLLHHHDGSSVFLIVQWQLSLLLFQSVLGTEIARIESAYLLLWIHVLLISHLVKFACYSLILAYNSRLLLRLKDLIEESLIILTLCQGTLFVCKIAMRVCRGQTIGLSLVLLLLLHKIYFVTSWLERWTRFLSVPCAWGAGFLRIVWDRC